MKKQINLKLTLLVCLLLVFGAGVNAQEKLDYKALNSEWKLANTSDGVQIFVKKMTCDLNNGFKPSTWLFYKVVNNNSVAKTISYAPALFFDGGCSNCGDNPERIVTINLEANSSEEGNCDFKNRALTVCAKNPNHKGGWVVKNIQVTNLSVK